MARLLKVPPELLLRIAGYLPKQRDCIALSLVSRNLRGVGEQYLYSNVVLRLKHDAATDNQVESFYHAIVANENRREWVRSLSVTLLGRPFTSRERKLLSRILRMLPRLLNFNFEYPFADSFDGNPFDLRRRHNRPTPLVSSLLKFTWLNAEILDASAFISFLRFHSNIKHLEFNEDNFAVPEMDRKLLPNLESIRAPIDAILGMLPRRRIQRIQTIINRRTLPDWKIMKDKDFENIRVFSSTVYGGPHAVKLLESLIRRMVNLEFLEVQDESVITPSMLNNTKIKFLRLRNLRDEFFIKSFFDKLLSLECVEIQSTIKLSIGPVSERSYRDGGRSRTVLWDCKHNEEWLHDWRDSVVEV